MLSSIDVGQRKDFCAKTAAAAAEPEVLGNCCGGGVSY
jgi:hypothetical protein